MISKQQALEIAKQACEERGWRWNDKTTVRWGLFCFTVWGGGQKGGNLFMKIRKKDGVILEVGMSPL